MAVILGLTLMAATSLSQEVPDSLKKVIEIKTSSQCDECKARIEKGLSKEDGIISSELTVENKIAKVVYNSSVTDPDQIRKAISKIGYDADDVPANKKAYNKLPKCCQKGGHE
jgi:periplasmic mercuric ion binding protein